MAWRETRSERQNRQFPNQRQCEQKQSNSQDFKDVRHHEHRVKTKVCQFLRASVLLNFWCERDQKRLWRIG